MTESLSSFSVSAASVAFMAVSMIICFGAPIALFIVLKRKYSLKAVPAIVGAAAFILFALVLESLCHNLILNGATGAVISAVPWMYMLYAGLMAGLFEETARLLSFILLKRKYHGPETGLSYGIGHGGIEAFVVVGFTMLGNLIFSLTLNSGALDSSTASTQPAFEQFLSTAGILSETPSYTFLAGGIERLIALALHISLSLLVWKAVNSKKSAYLFPVSIAIHAVANFPAALYQTRVFDSLLAVEGVTAAIAAAAVIFTAFIMRRRDGSEDTGNMTRSKR